MALTRQQRFARNVDGNIHTGIGAQAFNTRGFTFPTSQQMDKFDKYNLPHDIDPGVRDVVLDLNDAGYRTCGSCQGHQKDAQGFVNIEMHPSEIPQKHFNQVCEWHQRSGDPFSKKKIDEPEVKAIHKDHNIKAVQYKKPRVVGGTFTDYHSFQFPPVDNEYYTIVFQYPGNPKIKAVRCGLSSADAAVKALKRDGATILTYRKGEH